MSVIHHPRCALVLPLLFTLLCPPPAAWALSIGEERLIGQKILYSVRQELNSLGWADGSSTNEAKMTARAVAKGRLAHHRCKVDGCPWRMDF